MPGSTWTATTCQHDYCHFYFGLDVVVDANISLEIMLLDYFVVVEVIFNISGNGRYVIIKVNIILVVSRHCCLRWNSHGYHQWLLHYFYCYCRGHFYVCIIVNAVVIVIVMCVPINSDFLSVVIVQN